MNDALAALLERLKAATGPDQELDARILCAVAAPDDSFVEQSAFNGVWCIYCGEYRGAPRLWEDRKWGRQTSWNLTASIDTTLALVEKMLPLSVGSDYSPLSWSYSLLRQHGGGCIARLFQSGAGFEIEVSEEAATPSLAILAALLTALLERGKGD